MLLAELGDFNSVEHTEGYLSELQLLVDQNEETERQISELHKLHRGQMPADAECNYLEHAKRHEKYEIDFHNATDSSGKDIQLGVSSIGLLVYENVVLLVIKDDKGLVQAKRILHSASSQAF